MVVSMNILLHAYPRGDSIMLNWLLRWFTSAVALGIVSVLGIGVKIDGGISPLLMATLVIGLMNSLVRPVLSLLSLPLNCMTFGLFGFVLNAFLFVATGLFVPQFQVTSLLGGVLGPVLMGLISGFLNQFLPDSRKD